MSAFYIQSYLAFSLPAILAGFLAKSLGYQLTTDIYATAIILVTWIGFLGLRAERARAQRIAAGKSGNKKAERTRPFVHPGEPETIYSKLKQPADGLRTSCQTLVGNELVRQLLAVLEFAHANALNSRM